MTFQEILRKAANRIESGEIGYQWDIPTSCNCGIVAQVASGLNANAIYYKLMDDHYMGWSSWARNQNSPLNCPISQLPLHSICRILRESGFRPKDISDLEFLCDPETRLRAGLKYYKIGDYGNPRNVVKYMRAMADIRDEESKKLKTTDLVYVPSKNVIEDNYEIPRNPA